MQTAPIDAFAETFKPDAAAGTPDRELLDFGGKTLPPEILYLWQTYGFGDYGGGLIKVVDPRDYMGSLYQWLGKRDFTRIPLFVTAFGDLFYYRMLEGGAHDVALLDVHYRRTAVCAWSWQDFLGPYLSREDVRMQVLREPLFRQAVEALGPLKHEEIFFFVPALALGGGESLKYVRKGDGAVHHQVLLQLLRNPPKAR